MCGRFTLFRPLSELQERFDAIVSPEIEYMSRYNIAPSQQVVAVVEEEGKSVMKLFKWGLVPRRAKDPKIGYKMINARSETLAEKASFKNPFRRQRCLILSDGFYEWRKEGSKKIPIRFRLKDEQPFAFAGLWDEWQTDEGETLSTCTIITTKANEVVAPIHDRMPVILRPNEEKVWLSPSVTDVEFLQQLLVPYPESEMEAYEVSPLVNSPKNGGAELIEPINSR